MTIQFRALALIMLCLFVPRFIAAQEAQSNTAVKNLIEQYKKDRRGP